MSTEHPFQALFETFGRLPSVHAESVNRRAYESLWQVMAVGTDHSGRCILLKAPRAGHGKTHLLSRIQHNLGTEHEFIPLHAASGSFIDAGSVTADVLIRLSRPLPAGGGLCVLDLLVRKLFALALQPLVRSGEVPCQDREGALAALRNRPVETFDFHHPNAVTAHWARENFEVLGPRLALELAQRTGAPLREVMFWVDVLFRFAATPVEHPSRAGALIQAVTSVAIQPAQVFERLGALLGMLTQLVRVVLVADDVEGFSSDETAALRFASFLGSLRHSADRVDTILSINRDVWESAFLPRLTGGLADRLSEVVIELEPLTREEMVALLDARAVGLGERVFARLDLSNGERHARSVIRAASEAWLKAARPVHPLEEEAVKMSPPQVVAAVSAFSQPEPPAPFGNTFANPEAPAPPPVPPAPPTPPAPPAPPVQVAEPMLEAPPAPAAPAPAAPAVVSPPAWTPPPVEPPAVSSPFLQTISNVAQAAPEPPPVISEPVFEAPAATHEFLPPVEPVMESAPAGIPSLFEPTPTFTPVQEEVVPVGRLITDEEMAGMGFQPAPAAMQAIEPPPVPVQTPPPVEMIEPVFVPPPVGVMETVVVPPPVEVQSPFQPEPVAWNPPPTPEPAPPAWPTFGNESPFQSPPPVQAAFGGDSPFQSVPSEQGAFGSPSPFQSAPPAVETFGSPSPFQSAPPAQEPFGSSSPFQSAPPVHEPVVVETVPAPQPPPAFGGQAAFSTPVAPPVPEPVEPPAEAKETDRVDELLRQFRERYARG